MEHLMPGHVLSLTAGAVAYESKCALKISFSSRDAADKGLASARTSYGISYAASYLAGLSRALCLSFFLLPIFLSSRSRCRTVFIRASRMPLYRQADGIAKHKRDGILYAILMSNIIDHSETLVSKAIDARKMLYLRTIERAAFFRVDDLGTQTFVPSKIEK